MFHLVPHVSLCLSSVLEARAAHDPASKDVIYFTLSDEDGCVANTCPVVHLNDIFRFIKMMRELRRQNPNKKLIACAKAAINHLVAKTVLLLGAYMILELKMQLDEVDRAFAVLSKDLDLLSKCFVDTSISVHDCWMSLSYVRKLRWFDFGDDLDLAESESDKYELCDMDEYCHYADPANGGLHIIAPGRIFLITPPINLPGGQYWMDVGGMRQFSPTFFSDLLHSEFNSTLVLRLSHDSSPIEYDPSAFEDRGIAVESVSLGPRGSSQHHMLAAADRLIANLRGSPGPIAVQMGGPRSGGGADESLLLATGLMRVFGFGASEAAAWLRMACPPLCAAAALHSPAAALQLSHAA